MYQLKKNQPAFETVDGELVGRKFEHGRLYEAVPAREAHRFEEVSQTPEAQPAPGADDKGGEGA